MVKNIRSEIIAAPYASLTAAWVGAMLRLRKRTQDAAAGIKKAKAELATKKEEANAAGQAWVDEKDRLDDARSALQKSGYPDRVEEFALLSATNSLLEKQIVMEQELLDAVRKLDEATWVWIDLFEASNDKWATKIGELLEMRPVDGHYVPESFRQSVDTTKYPADQFYWGIRDDFYEEF